MAAAVPNEHVLLDILERLKCDAVIKLRASHAALNVGVEVARDSWVTDVTTTTDIRIAEAVRVPVGALQSSRHVELLDGICPLVVEDDDEKKDAAKRPHITLRFHLLASIMSLYLWSAVGAFAPGQCNTRRLHSPIPLAIEDVLQLTCLAKVANFEDTRSRVRSRMILTDHDIIWLQVAVMIGLVDIPITVLFVR